jgi:hypothetical protein
MEGGDQRMSTIDDRVVQLKFDNKQFETGVGTSLSTLDKLKKSLDFSAPSKSLNDLSSAGQRFNMGNIGTTVEGVSGKLIAMGTIGVTALANIANRAIDAGMTISKSLTVDPVGAGFKEYELKMGAIQTIMAGSGASLGEVNKKLQELNVYSDKTIYSFADMTQNIGKFTNAGVSLKDSVSAIKGVANVAAVSGANAEEASRAMYNFSQALSKGSVALIDWKSIELANMGTVEFKTQLLDAAAAQGILTKKGDEYKTKKGTLISATKGFNDSLQEEWLTTKVLTKTLGDYANENTKIGKKAYAAAQDVKTLSQMYDTLKEAAGSGWAQSFEIMFGNLTEAKGRWTALNNVIGGWIQTSADSRNAMLQQYKDMGGQKAAINAVKNAFGALMSVVKPIKEAFREIFPKQTAAELVQMTKQLGAFFKHITLGPAQMDMLKRTFAGLFAVLDIGKQIIMGVIGVFKTIFKTANESSGGFLTFTSRIGDFLVKVDDALKKGGALTRFFEKLATIIAVPIKWIGKLKDLLGSMFDGAGDKFKNTGDALGRIGDRLSPFGTLLNTLNAAWQRFMGLLQTFAPGFAKLLDTIKTSFSKIGPAIADSVANGNYGAMLDTLNTAIFGGIALMIRQFLKKGVKVEGSGFLKSISGAFDQLTGTLKAMETQIKAKALLEIAIAVGILTLSVVALSLIDSGKLTKALAGMAGIFTELMSAMFVLGKISGTAGFIKIPVIAASLILLSVAILLLTAAVKILSKMSWEEIGKGLTTLTGILAGIAAGMKVMPSEQMVANAAALILLGVALNLLTIAMKVIATMSWEDIGKGLTGFLGALGAISLTMNTMPTEKMVADAAALTILGVALNLIAAAMKIFATMSWEDMAKGLVGVGGSLVAIGLAMKLMPAPTMIATAAGLVVVGVALNIIALAVKSFGSMSWEEIAKGLVGLAGSLLILAGGLYLMTGTLMGSAALLVAAAALTILTPVLVTLGNMSWTQIATGLAALAGAFLVIGVAGLLLTPVIPQIFALSAAVALLGVGLALMGVAVLAFATGITLLVAAGSLGAAALTAILSTVIGLIPMAMTGLQIAIIAFCDVIINSTPKIVEAIVVFLGGLMDGIVTLTPQILSTLGTLLDNFIQFMKDYTPKIVEAGWQLLQDLLTGLENHIKDITGTVMRIIQKFLDEVAKNLPGVIKSGTDVIIAWIKGMGKSAADIAKAAGDTVLTFLTEITNWINNNTDRINTTMKELAKAIVNGIVAGLTGMITGLAQPMIDLVKGGWDAAMGWLDAHSPSKRYMKMGGYITQGLVIGIAAGRQDVKDSIYKIMDGIKEASDETLATISKLKTKIKGLEKDKTRTKKQNAELAQAKKDLAEAENYQKRLAQAKKTISVEHRKQVLDLYNLGSQYDATTKKLQDAQDAYANAVKERDDYAKSVKDSFSKLPTLEATSSLDDYFNAIRKATADNIKFKATMEQLRKLGLDDNQYKKFMEQGTAIQPFLDQLLASGGSTIAELNKIDGTLTDSATSLGKSASEALYQAGVDSAKGIVDGLQAQMANIIKQMKALGKAIADELKKELGIKSPSKVMAEIGKNTVNGLGKGMSDNMNVVDLAARRLGKTAVASLSDSLSAISGTVITDIDFKPVIAPVLDLNQFRKDAAGMNDILAPNTIEPTTSATVAGTISAAAQAQQNDLGAAAAAGNVVTLTQNNYSPVALSAPDIYRQTRNQMSTLKGALGA